MIGHDVIPPLSDDVQLTVEEYRNKLYEVCSSIFSYWQTNLINRIHILVPCIYDNDYHAIKTNNLELIELMTH